ncbi:hypothetical protein LCGC14_0577040 [marine sediment metagenome]|uniref:Uncharacterized protein n=1 Tax=marine sediment metagenome TaxID=412755 RepID=A0A0F9S129_9ZZZZ
MKKLYLSLFIFLLVLPSLFASGLEDLIQLGTTFTFPDAETSSISYVEIGSGIFNLTVLSDIAIDASISAKQVSGSATPTPFDWRMLLDGIEIDNVTISLEGGDSASIYLKGFDFNISSGLHNVSIEHRVTQDVLNSAAIILAVRNYKTVNLTDINHQIESVSFTTSGTDFVDLFNTTFETFLPSGRTATFLHGTINPSASTTTSHRILFDGQPSGLYPVFSSIVGDLGYFVQVWFFNTSIGTHNVSIQGLMSNGDTVTFNGELEFIERSDSGDNTSSFTVIDTVSLTSADGFIAIINNTINITENATFVSLFSSPITKSGGSKRDVSIFIEIDKSINLTIGNATLDGSEDEFIIGKLNRLTGLTTGFHNVTVFINLASGSLQTLTLTNVSYLITEIQSFESFVSIVDNPPAITLNNPLDLEILNTTNTSIFCTAIDDNQLTNISLFHNASGNFVLNETSFVSGLSATAQFNKTFSFNNTILWNCESFDNASQSSFASNNFTFDILETLPFLLNITLLDPSNNSIFTTFNSVNIDFIFNISTLDNICSLSIDNIITNTSNITTEEFVFGNFFNESETIEWFVNCTDTNQAFSETRIFSISIIQELKNEFDLNSCPVDTLPRTVLFIFFIVLALALSVIALQFKIAFIGVFGGFLLLSMSFFVGVCLGFAGILMFFLAMSLLFYHALIQ